MPTFLIFDLATGEIDREFSGSVRDAPLNAKEGQGVLEGEGRDNVHYVDPVELVRKDRAPLPLVYSPDPVDVGQALRIDGIPPGTTFSHPEGELVVDDGFVEWPAVEPGEYQLVLSNFPYLEEKINASFTTA